MTLFTDPRLLLLLTLLLLLLLLLLLELVVLEDVCLEGGGASGRFVDTVDEEERFFAKLALGRLLDILDGSSLGEWETVVEGGMCWISSEWTMLMLFLRLFASFVDASIEEEVTEVRRTLRDGLGAA